MERKPRPIEIFSIAYGGSPAQDEYQLTVRAAPGAPTSATAGADRRGDGPAGHDERTAPTSAGLYTEADAHTLEQILAAKAEGPQALQALALPVESALSRCLAGGGALGRTASVQRLPYQPLPGGGRPLLPVRSTDGGFLGLAQINGGVLKVEKLFVERS